MIVWWCLKSSIDICDKISHRFDICFYEIEKHVMHTYGEHALKVG